MDDSATAPGAGAFVRYSPDIETFDPNLDVYMKQLIDYWGNKVAAPPTAEGSGDAARGAHAKTLGCARAEVTCQAAIQTPVMNPLLDAYTTMASVRHGNHIAKVRVNPTTDSAGKATRHKLELSTGPDVFGPALIEDLKLNDFDFDLQVQLCTDLTKMPVNDATVEWPEALSPYVTVGRVHVPRQDISGTLTSTTCDALAFTQWRVRPERRPLGEIMDVRRIYSTSARVRREINHQPLGEPARADDVLPLSSVALSVDGDRTTRREQDQ